MRESSTSQESANGEQFSSQPPPRREGGEEPTNSHEQSSLLPASSAFRSPTSRTETSFLLEQALFSSYTSNGSVLPDEDDESLPSLSIEVPTSESIGAPPSPISRPPPSLLLEPDEDQDFITAASSHENNHHQQQQQQQVEQNESFPNQQKQQQSWPVQLSDQRLQEKKEQKEQATNTPVSAFSQLGRDGNQRPPVQEVLLNNEEDTFFEDRSLEQRAHRTLVTNPATAGRETPPFSSAHNSPLSTVQSSSPVSLKHQHQHQHHQRYQQSEQNHHQRRRRTPQPQVDKAEQPDISYYSSDDVSTWQTLIRMKEELVRANEKLKTMEHGNQLLAGERDALRQQLEAQQTTAQNQVTELKVELSRLQGVAETIQSQKGEWLQEKTRLDEKVRAAAREKKDLMHKRLASENRQKELKLQLDRLQSQLETTISEKTALQEDNGRLRQESTNLGKAKSELEDKLRTVVDQGAQAEQSRAGIEQEKKVWQEEKAAQQQELERLQHALEESKKMQEEFQNSRREEKEKLETALRMAEVQLKQVNETRHQEVETLQKSIQDSKATIEHLRSSNAALRSSGGTSSLSPMGGGLRSTTFGAVNTSNHQPLNTVRFQKEEGGSIDGTSAAYDGGRGASSGASTSGSIKHTEMLDPSAITDRLARIRDSSERAALIRKYSREIARLKEENEAMAQNLEAGHTEALRRARKHADLKLETRLHELKTSLSQEYDEKLEEVESRHRQQVSELQEQANKDKELGDESLRAAMSKLTEIIQQHERETARRKALERTMEQLQFEFEDEKKRLATRNAVELRKRRSEWEEERRTLLTIIQKECNSVFERRRTGLTSGTSRQQQQEEEKHQYQQGTTLREDMDMNYSKPATLAVDTSTGNSQQHLKDPPPPQVVTTSTARLISPTFSDFDSVLRETEELVQGLF